MGRKKAFESQAIVDILHVKVQEIAALVLARPCVATI
jgi:hypothetical protein